MDILFTHSPIHNPDAFYDAVAKFGPNPGHKLHILCSVDSSESVKELIAPISDHFESISVLAKRYNSPTTDSDYEYFDSRIISHLYTPRLCSGPMMILGRGSFPNEEGWADKCNRLILSSGVALTGYGELKDSGVVYSGTLLTNDFFSSYTIPKFPARSASYRHLIRYENIHHSYPLKSDDLPLTEEAKIPSSSDFAEIDKLVSNIQSSKNSSVIAKAENLKKREETYGDNASRNKKPMSKTQKKPSESNVRKSATTPFKLVKPQEAPVNQDVNIELPDIQLTKSQKPAESTKEENNSEDVPKVKKKRARKTTKKASKKTAKKRAKKLDTPVAEDPSPSETDK